MTRQLDSAGTRILTAVTHILAALARLTAIVLAAPATLALVQSTGRLLTGEFPIARGTWAFDIIYIYVRGTQHVFDNLSLKHFNELDPAIQALLVFIPNLVLVLVGLWSLISLTQTAFKR